MELSKRFLVVVLLFCINSCGMSHIFKKKDPKFVIQAGFEDNYLSVRSTNDIITGDDIASETNTDDRIPENITTTPTISILSRIKDLFALPVMGKDSITSEETAELGKEGSGTLYYGIGGRIVGGQRILDRTFYNDDSETSIRRMQFDTLETSGELLLGVFTDSTPLFAAGIRAGIMKYNLTIYNDATNVIVVNERDKILGNPTYAGAVYLDATVLLFPLYNLAPEFFDFILQDVVILYSMEYQSLNIPYSMVSADGSGSIHLYRSNSAISIVYVF